ncbi:hypothetical protein IB237_24070 [Agrobacterium sp. AGB01]|uniref:hypothetical protein n=1 Tax=Agrobacterium sp. AGB01 TaxID=2769302 RepID=UPI00177FD527|nr:hypothetical protein [Agrobacterium sp. AGB01]MBD9390282.1 hypothetical protein [Agrobacterium sp. AGB01]
MPTVPLYQDTQQRVALRPEYSENFTTRADADAFGAGVGRGMQALGKGMETAATNLNEAALRLKKLDDETRAKEATTEFSNWNRNALHGPGGFLSLTGKAAIEARPAFEKEAEKKHGDISKGLPPGARDIYERSSRETRRDTGVSVINHALGQQKTAVTDAFDGSIESHINDAVEDRLVPRKLEMRLGKVADTVEKAGLLLNWDKETIERKKAEYQSDAFTRIVTRIAETDPIAAEKYMQDHSERLLEKDKTALQERMKPAVLNAKATRNSVDIATGAPLPPDSPALLRPTTAVDYLRYTSGRHLALEALANFSKNATGNAAPTPWSVDIVKNVLGSPLTDGAQATSAKTFLNFGVATNSPRPGDIVVVSGESGSTEVGFFQGHDRNGNILMIAGQSDRPGQVSTRVTSSRSLLGFRTARNVDARRVELPNYNMPGITYLAQSLDAIGDAEERAATGKTIDTSYTTGQKNIDDKRDEIMQSGMTQISANNGFDPLKMSPEEQLIIGPLGVKLLQDHSETVQKNGQPRTASRRFYELQRQFANDPLEFAQSDLFNDRQNLSDEDWAIVTSWKELARTDPQKAREHSRILAITFKRLEDGRFVKVPAQMTEQDYKRLADLQRELYGYIAEPGTSNKDNISKNKDIRTFMDDLLRRMYLDNSGM